MMEVGRFDTRTDAEFARSLLAAARIPCVLASDQASGFYPIDLSGGACLLVADADARDAAEILSHHEPTDRIADEHVDDNWR
jgi:hypothetical protein